MGHPGPAARASRREPRLGRLVLVRLFSAPLRRPKAAMATIAMPLREVWNNEPVFPNDFLKPFDRFPLAPGERQNMNLAKQTRLPFAAASIAWVLLSANAFGAAGDLYVSVFGPGQNIVRISPDGTKTSVTGPLIGPTGLAFDAKGVLYVAQYDGTIVKIINGTATPFVSGLPT